VACPSNCSMLLWWVLVGALAVAELGAAALLVHLSTKLPADKRQE
jgi:hypothetical protein